MLVIYSFMEKLIEMLINTRVLRAFPKLHLSLLVKNIGCKEEEMYIIKSLCDENKLSVDIGGYVGDYSFHMAKHSRWCHVFEPRPEAVDRIEEKIDGMSLPITVHEVALSDSKGEMKLRIASECPERSTLEEGNSLEKFGENKVDVPVRRLDDFDLREVGCIKIDVEGHELSVLEGAINTIRRDKPSLIIESEERHRKGAVDEMVSLLEPLGYESYFIKNGKIKNIDKFDAYEDQVSMINGKYIHNKTEYINNFIFIAEKYSKDIDLCINQLMKDLRRNEITD